MQRDRQRVLVDAPELLEDEFRLRTRVDEDQRHLRSADRRVDFGQRMPRAVAGPWQALLRIEDREFGRRAGRRRHEIGEFATSNDVAAQFARVAHGGGQPRDAMRRRETSQPREAQG